jgi:hypothetical protein
MSEGITQTTLQVHLPEELLTRLGREKATDEFDLADPSLSRLAREREAFLRLLPQLLTTHHGQYVAIHDEQVIDSGPERLEVAQRAQEKVKEGVYVGLVSDEPEPIYRSGVRRGLRQGKTSE